MSSFASPAYASSTYASPADTSVHGTYRVPQKPDDPRPLLRFDGRLGSPEFPAIPGRYHLYSGWFCPWAQRSTAVLAVAGVDPSVVSVSSVHGDRDGRGWAFREPTGADPVNDFTLLRQAYEATEAGFDGHVSTPTLWDREGGRVVSNTYAHLDRDLASTFGAEAGRDLYPVALRRAIDDAEAWLHPALNQGVGAARADGAAGEVARVRLVETLTALNEQLGDSTYLVGDQLTIADLRVIVTLLRFDTQANADGALGPTLQAYSHLWDYARAVYQEPGVRATTLFEAFAAPEADVAQWDRPSERIGGRLTRSR
ncbi:glutathione S-transferase C-terminal domain-containing protein [Ornithinimicrobium faecis]|uniref:glutathione S-transferase C-terminal domain-containing protein n=1 Tax=Ornithinimicrobium faecis TaxID=2934158 RepID=UPI0021190D58|nr:glutathione S-transferase C-terminal domain-containing protein [Ornithinimicrobium sp. HY1745]